MPQALQSLPNDMPLQADICIVGAGAAGLTLAAALLKQRRSVLLLEAGDQDFDAATQALYAGDNLGEEYYELEHARLRFFGGTTNIWGGRSVPLAPIDMRQRSWVPHSGWPIDQAALAPYLQQAHTQLQLGDYQYDQSLWPTMDSADPFANDQALESWFWRFDEAKERFGWQAAAALRSHPLLRIVLNANVTSIEVNPDGNMVQHLIARPLNGTPYQVQANHFILACGGIENARILLASNNVQPDGVGNDQDQVGRYFMEHPHARIGTATGNQAYELWFAARKRRQGDGVAVAPAFVLSEELQAQRRALNNAVTFKLQRQPNKGVSLDKRLYLRLKHDLNPGKQQRALWHLYRNLRDRYQHWLRPGVERARAALGVTQLSVILRAEQAPNPDSRVRLLAAMDSLGMPKTGLDWRRTALDKHSALAMAEVLREVFERQGFAPLQIPAWLQDPQAPWPVDPTVSNHPIGGYHHMGTTRMSEGSTDGVVDANCTVHGYRNLHIAGSSVFATAGWANPTLTIIALALRLAEHLQRDNR